jgi:hypothetical protein
VDEFFKGKEVEVALVNYIRFVADVMGLKDWQFFVKPKPTPEYLAYTHVWGDSRTADMCFSEDFFNLGPNMQREVICHELIHWHFDALSRFTRASFREHVGGSASVQFGISFKQGEEMLVDGIASAWARSMPAINWDDNTVYYSDEYERDNAGWDDSPVKDGS